MMIKRMGMSKRIITGIAVLALFLTVFWLCMAVTAHASSVKLTPGKKYKFTVGEDDEDVSWTFSIPARGVVTWSFSGSDILAFKILNKKKKPVWQGEVSYLQKSGRVTYKVGLQKGTYIAEVSRQYKSWTSSGDHYKLTATYKKTGSFEIESNNSFTTATELKLGKQYQAVFWDEYSGGWVGDREDYYKVKLTKGKNYQIQFSNFIKLFKGNSYKVNFKLYAPNKRTIIYSYDSSYSMSHSTLPKNGRLTFTAGSTGWYYIRLTAAYAPAQPMAFKVKVVKR